MDHTRRTFLGTSALGMATLGRTLAKPLESSNLRLRSSKGSNQFSKPRAYKIIYNWDGAPHQYSEFPQTLEQFLEKVYAPMKDTQVGAHFWCIGEHEAKWPSKTMPIAGDSQGRIYDSLWSMRHYEGVRAMFERGENPYQAMVNRGHQLGMHVYASVRMNDNHFNGLQVTEMPDANMDGLTQLRRDHPEWCLGPKQAPKWFAASWNFGIPEVREHRLQHITEVCELADWDGIELDWQRHAFHLPFDDAYRLRYTLTDLQRALRRLTQQIGRKRGKPFYLAVRVATTLESCRRIGYDLPTWVKEGLCDVIIAGGGAGTDPGIEVDAFHGLLKDSGIQFYAGFDSGFWGTYTGLKAQQDWNQATVRATATSYWERGATGMYAFNWHANDKTRHSLLTTIGTPQTLKHTDKVYSSLHRHFRGWAFADPKEVPWAGADFHDRIYGETPVKLYQTMTEEGPRFHIGVYDDTVREAQAGNLKKSELQVELKNYSAADQVEVTLDGSVLPRPKIRNVAAENPDDPSDVSENSWLVWSLEANQAKWGIHQIQIRLVKRDPRLKPPLTVQNVEIHLKYGT